MKKLVGFDKIELERYLVRNSISSRCGNGIILT